MSFFFLNKGMPLLRCEIKEQLSKSFTSNFQSCYHEVASLYSLTNVLLTLNVSSTGLVAQAVTLLRHFNEVKLGTKLSIFQDNTSQLT